MNLDVIKHSLSELSFYPIWVNSALR